MRSRPKTHVTGGPPVYNDRSPQAACGSGTPTLHSRLSGAAANTSLSRPFNYREGDLFVLGLSSQDRSPMTSTSNASVTSRLPRPAPPICFDRRCTSPGRYNPQFDHGL
jgi:hypothetical protein